MLTDDDLPFPLSDRRDFPGVEEGEGEPVAVRSSGVEERREDEEGSWRFGKDREVEKPKGLRVGEEMVERSG